MPPGNSQDLHSIMHIYIHTYICTELTEQNPVGQPFTKVKVALCLLFLEKPKSLRPPRVTKEQVQAVNDQDNRVTASFMSDAHFHVALKIL